VKQQYDIAVIGSGFAGSLMAMIAHRLGRSVVLIEKGSHPRVVIGESSTPLSTLLLDELVTRYNLPLVKPLTKWGSWQRTYPNIACGLKRGFSFFHHQLDRDNDSINQEDRQLLVAASPHDDIADTHWFRADFDHFLIERAREIGVDYIDKLNIITCKREGQNWKLVGERDTLNLHIQARILIDASGPRGFLHRALGLEEQPLPDFPQTSSLHSHFSGVRRFQDTSGWPVESAPYPLDDAALHHVFDGGWIWVLRFNNGWTSAGIAATESVARRFHLQDREPAWYRLLESLPLVREQFSDARPMMPFTYSPRLSYLSSTIAGDHWAMLPSAAGFFDPLLSTGIPLTLLGIVRLATLLEENWESATLPALFSNYAEHTRSELLATAQLIAALYRNMADFTMFRSLSMLYFAASSYAETARWLNKPELANGFLLHEDPVFGPECRRLLALANNPLNPADKQYLTDHIYLLIEQFDVAGVCKRPRNHCYPLDATDLIASAHKLGVTREEIDALLERSGFLARRPG
jgi:FADH2 O2-dependent halogenase